MIRVGLLDSGVDAALAARVTAAAAFTGAPLDEDRLGHGSALARIILQYAPDAALLNAQAFGPQRVATPEQVAAALGWLAAEGAHLVNLSIGLRQDRAVLAAAVAEALAAGVVLVASSPARGGPVYPAAYAGVLRVSGDARCRSGEVSRLGGAPADYGACPEGPGGALGGASFAAAHVTGLLARAFGAGARDPRIVLDRLARFHGPERRSADPGERPGASPR